MCRGQFSNSLAGQTEMSDGFWIVELCGRPYAWKGARRIAGFSMTK
jgi:hypothetical protein